MRVFVFGTRSCMRSRHSGFLCCSKFSSNHDKVMLHEPDCNIMTMIMNPCDCCFFERKSSYASKTDSEQRPSLPMNLTWPCLSPISKVVYSMVPHKKLQKWHAEIAALLERPGNNGLEPRSRELLRIASHWEQAKAPKVQVLAYLCLLSAQSFLE